jgi:hypothetical protein
LCRVELRLRHERCARDADVRVSCRWLGHHRIYLHVPNYPDGNGIEIDRDRPQEEWPRAPYGKGIAMVIAPLDLNALLAEAG